MFLTLFDNIVPKSPDLRMTVRRKEENKMGTSQVVLTKKISLWEDPEIRSEGLIGTKNEVLKILSEILDKNQHPLFDLVLYTDGQGSTGPFVNKIFILGRREVISCNLQEIAERIASKKRLKKNEVWIRGIWIGFDPLGKPRIEELT